MRRVTAVVAPALLAVAVVAANATQGANTTANVDALANRMASGQTVRGAVALPVASSSQIERSGALQRVQFEEFDASRLFPSPDAEVRTVWNGWHVNTAIDAFRSAIDRNVPLVLVVSEGWCEPCRRLATDALRCPAVDRFAGEAVFAFSSPSTDRGASAIASSLDIDAYPTITVLEPDARMLLERGRINGYFDASKLGEHFDTILWKTEPRRYVDEFGVEERRPGVWTPRAAPIGSELGASIGATNRGLKHTPPAPNCR
ncbi:MAG TPA: thioredoxin family protein [Vicinamibacterales bacterium]|jgi:hypothetical protein